MILVLRSSSTYDVTTNLFNPDEHTTLYSGRTGAVLWNKTSRLAEGLFALQKMEVTTLPGGPFAGGN